jgi:hypothetical protein
MTGDAFGALATLPLFCLGQLPSPDPLAVVRQHFDVWHSCLVVVREVMKAGGGMTDQDARDSLAALIELVADLRDAYIDIHLSHCTAPQGAAAAFERLQAAYDRMPLLVREFAATADVEASFLPKPHGLKAMTHQRTLQWLAQQFAADARRDRQE